MASLLSATCTFPVFFLNFLIPNFYCVNLPKFGKFSIDLLILHRNYN